MTNPPNKLSREQVVEDLKEKAEKVDGPITIEKYKELGGHSIDPIKRIFGSWNNAKEEAGLEKATKRLRKEEILEDLKQTAEKVGEPLGVVEYNEHGTHHSHTIRRKFGSWRNAVEKAGVEAKTRDWKPDEEMIDFMESMLKKEQGRLSISKINEEMKKNFYYNRPYTPKIIEELNERDNGLEVIKGSNKKNGKKVFVNNDRIGIYDEYLEILPEETHKIFERVMNDYTGKSPQATAGAILYMIDEDATQSEVADKMGCTPVSVRNSLKHIEEEGYAEDVNLDEVDA